MLIVNICNYLIYNTSFTHKFDEENCRYYNNIGKNKEELLICIQEQNDGFLWIHLKIDGNVNHRGKEILSLDEFLDFFKDNFNDYLIDN